MGKRKLYFSVSPKLYCSPGRLERDHFLSRAATLNLRFSEAIEPIFDRLDIFSDAIDLKNTLVLLFLRICRHNFNITDPHKNITLFLYLFTS